MVERLIRVGHLRRYARETVCGAEVAPTVERITTSTELPPESRPTINYILGGPTDNQYQSKRQKKRLLRATTVRAWVNTIHTLDNNRAIQPIDGLISFPPINSIGSLVHTMMHLYLLYVSTILMSNGLIHIEWMRSSRISEGALGRPPHSSTRYLWIRLRQWKNCTDGRINIKNWRIISRQPPRP